GEPTIPTAHRHPHPTPPRNPTGTRIIHPRAAPGLPQSPATHSTQITYATHKIFLTIPPACGTATFITSLPFNSVARSDSVARSRGALPYLSPLHGNRQK